MVRTNKVVVTGINDKGKCKDWTKDRGRLDQSRSLVRFPAVRSPGNVSKGGSFIAVTVSSHHHWM